MVQGMEADEVVRVLVVDDEALVAMFLRDLLEDLGYRVVGPIADAEKALAAAAEVPPQIAVVDISLRGRRDGIVLAQTLAEVHGTTVIFMTGYADAADDPDVSALGPVAVLQKPCLPDAIESALARACLASAVPSSSAPGPG